MGSGQSTSSNKYLKTQQQEVTSKYYSNEEYLGYTASEDKELYPTLYFKECKLVNTDGKNNKWEEEYDNFDINDPEIKVKNIAGKDLGAYKFKNIEEKLKGADIHPIVDSHDKSQ